MGRVGGCGLWGTLGMLLVVVALGIVVWAVTRATQPHPPAAAAADRAQEIVAERYARGELSTEEYHDRFDALRGRPRDR
jgi:putative membrane protein